MSERYPLNACHRPGGVVPVRLAWPAVAILALAGVTPALAMRSGLPMPGVSTSSSAAGTSSRSSPTASSTSSSSATAAAGHTASTAGRAAPARVAPSHTPAAPTHVTAAPPTSPGRHAGSPVATTTTVIHHGTHPAITAMMRVQPGASRSFPSQVVASAGGNGEGGSSGSTGNARTPPASVAAGGNSPNRDTGGAMITHYQPPPGIEQRPHTQEAHATPGAGPAAPTTVSTTSAPADTSAPSSSTPGNGPDRFAAAAGTAADSRTSSSSTPARVVASAAAADTASRSSTRTAVAESRPTPLAEIVPTAAEWSDARRQASAARVVPMSQTQTLAGGAKVARTADCVPTTFVPDAKRPGQLSIGHSSRDLARSVSTTQDVARLFARTRFDGVDLGVKQSMCLPPDLAGRLAQLPPTTGVAARPAPTLRAGKSRVEPATGATG